MTTIRAEAVEQLLRQLNAEDWRIGTDQFIAVHDVMLALSVNPDLLQHGGSVVDWIAPIVCTSRGDQEIFRERFKAMEESAEDEASLLHPTRSMSAATARRRVLTTAILALMSVAVTILLYVYAPDSPTQQQTGGPTPVDVPANGWPSIIMEGTFQYAPRVIVVLTLVALLFWLGRRRHHDLSKVFEREKDLEHHFPRIATSVFIPASFRRVTQRLRLRRNVETTNLNVPRSVEQTAKHAGFFMPVYATRAVTPEYVALIDRSSVDDQQAILYRTVLDRVRGDDVIVHVYEFSGDPRICWREGREESRYTLDDLAARHADGALLLFGDGAEFLHPLTREPYRWTKSMATSFRSTALFTSRPVDEWDDAEWQLAQAGMLVLPSTTSGFTAFVDALEQPQRELEVEPPDGGPRSILADEDLWISNTPPPRESIEELLHELNARLGEDGLTWLAACAVYPALHWHFTLFLGSKLRISNMERKLVSLVRLPWFRRGGMPDWLRAELILTLPRPVERQIRKHLEELFRRAVREMSGDSQLHLVTFRNIKNSAPDDSPLREFVLVRFMGGHSPKPLSVRVSEMFEGVRSAMSRPATRRDPAWRVVVANIPVLGFFATMGKHASAELRWHAWNAVAVVFGALAAWISLPKPKSLVVVAAIAGAILLAAIRSALRGGRLRIPVVSRMADHLSAAEGGEPLNAAWRLLFLLGSYTNPVTAAMLSWIRLPDLRWHARFGLIGSAIIIGTGIAITRASSSDTGIPVTLWAIAAFALLGVVQGMRKRPLLNVRVPFVGVHPAPSLDDRSWAVPMTAAFGIAVLLYELAALRLAFAGELSLAMSEFRTLAIPLGIVLVFVGDFFLSPRTTFTAGITATALALASFALRANEAGALLLIGGFALSVSNAVVLTSDAARAHRYSAAAVLSTAVLTIALLLPVMTLLDDLLARALPVAAAIGGVLAMSSFLWTRALPRELPPLAAPPWSAFVPLFAVGFVPMPFLGTGGSYALGPSEEWWLILIFMAPGVVLSHFANALQSDPLKRVQTSLVILSITMAMANASYHFNIGTSERAFGLSLGTETVLLFFGATIVFVVLVPAGWLAMMSLPSSWRATGVAVWNSMLAVGVSLGEDLRTFLGSNSLQVASALLMLTIAYSQRARLKATIITYRALLRRWTAKPAPAPT